MKKLDAQEIAYYAVRGADPVKDVEKVADMIEEYALNKVCCLKKELKICCDAIEGITSQSKFESDIPNYIKSKYEL